jgi:hypothetical protein
MTQLDANRRAHHRFTTRFPLKVDAGARKDRLGVAYDASAGGLLFNTASRFEPGTVIELSMLPPSQRPPASDETVTADEPIQVKARVVRVESVPRESTLPWRWLTAVQFEHELPDLADSVRSASLRPPPVPTF